MMGNKFERGFGPLVIIIIVAIILVVGGGVYYASEKSSMKSETNTDVQAGADANVSAGTESGTFRNLLAMGRDLVCKTNFVSGNTTVSGTTYISGDMMRGDFTTTGTSQGTMESHMIKQGNTIFSWSGTQGAKMDVSKMNTDTSAQNQSSVNLDQKVDYNCQSWSKDSSKFDAPSGVSFIDLNAMMQNQNNIQVR